MRDSREPQTEGSVSPRARAGRRPRVSRRLGTISFALLLPLVLVLGAFLAPIGQAHTVKERTPEEEAARAATKLAEKEQRAAERLTEREIRRKTRTFSKSVTRSRSDERENGIVKTTCTQVSWTFRNFPNLPGNTVVERLTIGHRPPTFKIFTFDGSTGTDVVPINAPPGPGGHGYQIDTWGKWTTNGFHGAFDIHTKVKCTPAPALSIEKLQQIAGAGGSYTGSQLSGQTGQTVAYEILVRNTGNVPLNLSSFADPRCDTGTISGGTGGEPLAAGSSTTYLCSHLLGTVDQTAGSYSNTVSLTGTPPTDEGPAVLETSNTVIVEVHPPSPTEEKPRETPTEDPKTTMTATQTAGSGTLGSTTGQPPRSGVLAFSSASVPSLSGPQGCVRRSFKASIKSAGVASVIFYLDGHKLRRMTAHSARNGRLTIVINPSKLSVGAHRLLAKITMVKAPGAAKAVTASRRRTVLRCRSAALTPKFTG